MRRTAETIRPSQDHVNSAHPGWFNNTHDQLFTIGLPVVTRAPTPRLALQDKKLTPPGDGYRLGRP